MKSEKIGRNDPCPCGSGKKFKFCCLDKPTSKPPIFATIKPTPFSEAPPEILEKIKEVQLKEEQRIANQGYGKPILSIEFQGKRLVFAGGQYYSSGTWKTFHDFLFSYIKLCLGPDWGTSEIQKPIEKRHVILQWYDALCVFFRTHKESQAGIFSAPTTGPVGAYLSLAYDLYFLQHNASLQKRLIDRLKKNDQFQGARYEIYVAASFLKAGFEIDFEDETDGSKSHCEFVAKHSKTGSQYSVEVKSRHRPGLLGREGKPESWEKINPRIGNLLAEALKKEASQFRIIFIDLNMPPENRSFLQKNWLNKVRKPILEFEQRGIAGDPCPSAFIFFTNHPSRYVGNEELEPQRNFMLTDIGIPELSYPNPGFIESRHPTISKL